MQKKIIRIITFSTYLAHTQPLFHNLSILPLDKLILDRIGILMFKYSNGLLPVIINNLYVKNKDIHSHNTRSKNRLRAPTGSMYFTNTSAHLWNVLVTKIDVQVPLSKFKLILKCFLLNNTVNLRYSK